MRQRLPLAGPAAVVAAAAAAVLWPGCDWSFFGDEGEEATAEVWAWGYGDRGQLGDGTMAYCVTPAKVVGPGGVGLLSGVRQIAAGGNHCAAVKDDGTVWTWGSDGSGELGDGMNESRPVFVINDGSPTPVQVVGPGGTGYLTGVAAVAAGQCYTVALRDDDAVWAWGRNNYGQLGDGTLTDRHSPVQVVGPGGSGFLTGVTAIAAGNCHTVALRDDGTAWAWGNNAEGQFGDGTIVDSSAPVQVVGAEGVGSLTGVTAVAGGEYHTVALRDDGSVWAWGDNNWGQLGDGTQTDCSTPVQVVGPGGVGYLTGVVGIVASWGRTVAVRDDGTAWEWGMGSGATPVQVVGPGDVGYLTGVAAVAVGISHTAALEDDSTVWAWGANYFGQLGDGMETGSATPVQVVGPGGVGFLTGVTAIDAGCYHTIALADDGTVWSWGDHYSGQLGNGKGTASFVPVGVLGPGGLGYLTGVAAIAATSGRTVALRDDGTVWAWGAGDPTVVQVVGPGGVGFLMGVTAIAAGDDHTVALSDSDSVWTWGDNIVGQLGDGSLTSSPRPVQVVGPGGSGYLTGVTSIAAGGGHTVAARDDGTVWTWGLNDSGQLGDGAVTNSPTPVQVVGPGGVGYLTGVTSVAAGGGHSTALRDDGTVWTWGWNYFGQLGDGTVTGDPTPTPVQVVGPGGVGFLSDVTAVSAAPIHTVALRDDGTVWAWGSNRNGQLGDGSTTRSLTPVQVVGPGGVAYLSGVVAIAVGYNHTVAVRGDGTMWAWGLNDFGQLGDGTVPDSTTPVQVLGPGGDGYLTGVTAIAAGYDHTVAVTK